MNGFTEPLPGLLDDPQFPILSLPGLQDVHIAPLRNPAPLRHGNAPLLPLEPLTKPSDDHRSGVRNTTQIDDEPEKIPPPRLRPSDVLSAREAKKPHLAISELLETNNDVEIQHLQLPSFVSLAVVEKSPIQEPSRLSPHKRLRLDLDVDAPSRDVGRRLPRPAQKDDKQARPVPLLPAMVTGLHEPPPSAGILPSMELDARPNIARPAKSSKMQVKDILAESKKSTHVPPEAMLNTPDLPTVELVKPKPDDPPTSELTSTAPNQETSSSTPKKDHKTRRARRKWTEEETADLMAGVKKHGFGKWKQILTDKTFLFHDRTSIDLKDRYRVFVKDQPESNASTGQSNSRPRSEAPARDTRDAHVSNIPEPSSSKTTSENTEANKAKRKRRPWTPAEDAALMRGLSRYGFQWTAIHDDQELDLSHRRATDLRDRIRNLYPEGYKHAEARPLKSEFKKVEKAAQDSTTLNVDANSTTIPSTKKSVLSTSQDATFASSSSSQSKSKPGRAKGHKSSNEIHQAVEHAGVTLPSLALNDDGEMDWGDNTLPPLLEWEEIGI